MSFFFSGQLWRPYFPGERSPAWELGFETTANAYGWLVWPLGSRHATRVGPPWNRKLLARAKVALGHYTRRLFDILLGSATILSRLFLLPTYIFQIRIFCSMMFHF